MRILITEDKIKTNKELFDTILRRRIKSKGDLSFTSTHEILGIIEEELLEFKEAVRGNDSDRAFEELYDIMVATFWGICSMDTDNGMDW